MRSDRPPQRASRFDAIVSFFDAVVRFFDAIVCFDTVVRFIECHRQVLPSLGAGHVDHPARRAHQISLALTVWSKPGPARQTDRSK